MNKFSILSLGLLLGGLTLMSSAVSAQEEEQIDVHPFLTSKFQLQVGVFFPDKEIELSASGRIGFAESGDSVDFDEALKLGDSENVGFLAFRWNHGKKWWLEGEYFASEARENFILEEDIEWQDFIFKEGSFVRAGLDVDVARLFFGRKVLDRPETEVSIGFGLHWMELMAFVEGDIESNLGDTDFVRADADTGFPLPNFGVELTHSMSPRWALISRVDWLSVSLDKYSGRMWNVNIGVNFALSKHVGLGARWQYFNLDGSIKNTDWRGRADLIFHGPVFKLTGVW